MTRFSTALALIATFVLAAGAQAQDAQPADQDVRQELRTMVTGDDAAADRAAIREALDSDAVRQAAEQSGLDLQRAKDRVGTLSAGQAAEIAERFLDDDGNLVGGDTVVITSTTIIIILLILLLIQL